MALVFYVTVVPSSGRHAWVIDKNGRLKCFLKSAAENNKANTELLKSIASALAIAHTQVQILTGATSKKKMIRCETSVSYEEFLSRLGLGMQQTLVR